jgi:hypothetical protein
MEGRRRSAPLRLPCGEAGGLSLAERGRSAGRSSRHRCMPLLRCTRRCGSPAGELAVSVTIVMTHWCRGCETTRKLCSAGGSGGARAHADTGGGAPRAGGGGMVGRGVCGRGRRRARRRRGGAADAAARRGRARPAAARGLSAGLWPGAACWRSLLASACVEQGTGRPAARVQGPLACDCEWPQGWADVSKVPSFWATSPPLRAASLSGTAGWACWSRS